MTVQPLTADEAECLSFQFGTLKRGQYSECIPRCLTHAGELNPERIASCSPGLERTMPPQGHCALTLGNRCRCSPTLEAVACFLKQANTDFDLPIGNINPLSS